MIQAVFFVIALLILAVVPAFAAAPDPLPTTCQPALSVLQGIDKKQPILDGASFVDPAKVAKLVTFGDVAEANYDFVVVLLHQGPVYTIIYGYKLDAEKAVLCLGGQIKPESVQEFLSIVAIKDPHKDGGSI